MIFGSTESQEMINHIESQEWLARKWILNAKMTSAGWRTRAQVVPSITFML